MKITKLPYSHAPWRLVTSDGREVQAPSELFNHPLIGATMIRGSIRGNTKAECIEAALDFLEKIISVKNGKYISEK